MTEESMKCAICDYRSTEANASLCRPCLRSITRMGVYRNAGKPSPPLIEAGQLRTGDVFYGVIGGHKLTVVGHYKNNPSTGVLVTENQDGTRDFIGASVHVIPAEVVHDKIQEASCACNQARA